MMKSYYLDTSIWLDFFEERDEPNMPKSQFARELLRKIVNENSKLVISEAVKNELIGLGYSRYEIERLFQPFQKNIVEVYTNKKQYGKAKDLKNKRNIPLLDALHAVLARNAGAVMVTRDRDFNKLLDITKSKKPEDLI